jgi:3-oxoacyl-[acyl-carrier protein] reductase
VKRRRALITGASGDLGAAIARLMARQSYDLVLHANQNVARLDALAAELEADGHPVQKIAFDLTDETACAEAMKALLEPGAMDCVISNAGLHDDAPMAGMRSEQWSRVIDVSLNGFFRVVQPCLLAMARQRFGRVIAVSSVAGQIGNRGQANYAAAKSALHGAVRSLAREMASRGVTANAVAPGLIEGSMGKDSFTPEQIKQIIPAQRAGRAEEIAAVIAFIASDAASYVNGQVIGVNGGMA